MLTRYARLMYRRGKVAGSLELENRADELRALFDLPKFIELQCTEQ